jgi:hypothetical protein
MGKTTEPAPPPAAAEEEEDPVWGDMLAGFFSVGRFATASAPPPVPEDKPAAKNPARKRPKAR